MRVVKNNFEILRKQFTADTGLIDSKENAEALIAYVQARMVDTQCQILSFIYEEICAISKALTNK